MKDITLPTGLRDQVGMEAVKKDLVSDWILKRLRSRGYQRVITPLVERKALFDDFNMARQLYRVVDMAGEELVLRPDLTLPIARLLATTNFRLPQKFYYLGERFQATPQMSGGQNEQTQAGIELIGYDSLKAEMEGVILMHQLNNELLDHQLTIELGHAQLVDCILGSLKLSHRLYRELKQALYHKNFPAYEVLLKQVDAPKAMSFLKKWPWMFGTAAEVHTMLKEVAIPNPAKPLLKELSIVADFANNLAEQQVIIDLSSEVPQRYYTGIVMKGYVEKNTSSYLISGGRYDRLLANFQDQIEPAVGLGINIDALAGAARVETTIQQPVFVYARIGQISQITTLIESNANYSLALADSLTEARRQARAAGAKLMVWQPNEGLIEC